MSRHAQTAAALLGRHAGFKVEMPNPARMDRILREAAGRRDQSVEQYVSDLEHNWPALDDLIDRVTVQETSFFRHPAHFEVLARDILPRLDGPVTIWSAACANGQEAYSLAMVLDESGHDDWKVIATDIAGSALARTRAAQYETRELRGVSDERRERHLVREGTGFAVRPSLGRQVSIARHNLATEEPPFAAGRAQVVFCRNVLIYLESDVAIRVLDRLHTRMPGNGYLFLGASESLWHLTSSFKPVRVRRAYVHRPEEWRGEAAPARVAATSAARPARPVAVVPKPELPTPAALVCEGERAAAAGDHHAAASAFRKAGYLDPSNVHAALSLGLALEAAGDASGARRAFRSAQGARLRGAATGLEGYGPEALDRMLADKLEEVGS